MTQRRSSNTFAGSCARLRHSRRSTANASSRQFSSRISSGRRHVRPRSATVPGATARAAPRGCPRGARALQRRRTRHRRRRLLRLVRRPARAIRCAQAIHRAVEPLDLELRAGLHTGECELLDDKVSGIAVAIGARVASRAAPGEVLVSQTVEDLVAGSGIAFDDGGVAELKGVPGEWRLYAVCSPPT